MAEQKLYYLKCTAKKECKYTNITIHPGEVFYYTPTAAAREMSGVYNSNPYRRYESYLPFTRNEKAAKKWQKLNAAERAKRILEEPGEFDVEIVTLVVKYVYEVAYD